MIHVAITNKSTVLSAQQVHDIVVALQEQVTNHFYPIWGINASLTNYITKNPPSQYWVLGIFDDADQANALGYHEVTPAGLPIAKVFAKTSLDDGSQPSVVCSHELLEMLADPWINVWVMDSGDPTKFWIREACDAVESDADGYTIGSVLVSDFVTPAYFQPDLGLLGPFDYKQVLSSAVPALSPGGYMSFVQNGQISQIFGQTRERMVPGKIGGSSRVLRMLNRPDWQRSNYVSEEE